MRAWRYGEWRFEIADRGRVAAVLRRAVRRTEPRLVPASPEPTDRERQELRQAFQPAKSVGGLRSEFWLKRTGARVKAANAALAEAWKAGKVSDVALDRELGTSTTDLLRAVAAEWGISFETLYRLLTGSASSISWHTLLRIERNLTENVRRALRSAALPRATQRAFREWGANVERETRRLREGPGRRAKHEVERKDIDPRERALWTGFEDEVRAKGLTAARAVLGAYRVYDVLVSWGHLQRELRPAERLVIVKAGWRRERALLAAEFRFLRTTKRTP